MQTDAHDMLSETSDERMPSVKVFSFPSPTEAGEHVEGEVDVFERNVGRKALDFGYMSVEDDHGGDMDRNGGSEKGNVGELDKLGVDDDDVVGSDDGVYQSLSFLVVSELLAGKESAEHQNSSDANLEQRQAFVLCNFLYEIHALGHAPFVASTKVIFVALR